MVTANIASEPILAETVDLMHLLAQLATPRSRRPRDLV